MMWQPRVLTTERSASPAGISDQALEKVEDDTEWRIDGTRRDREARASRARKKMLICARCSSSHLCVSFVRGRRGTRVRDWSAMMEQGSPVAPYIRSGLDRSPEAVCAGRSGRGGSFYGTCRERGLASYRHTPSRARLDTKWRRRSFEEAASTRAPRPQESDHLSDSATSLPSACGRGRRCRSGVAVCLRRQNVPATSASGRC